MGFQEGLILVFVIALVVGWGRLPQIGDGLGRAIRNFNRSLRGDNEIDVTPPKELPDADRKKDD